MGYLPVVHVEIVVIVEYTAENAGHMNTVDTAIGTHKAGGTRLAAMLAILMHECMPTNGLAARTLRPRRLGGDAADSCKLSALAVRLCPALCPSVPQFYMIHNTPYSQEPPPPQKAATPPCEELLHRRFGLLRPLSEILNWLCGTQTLSRLWPKTLTVYDHPGVSDFTSTTRHIWLLYQTLSSL